MKTVLQALKDELYYPVNEGLLENKLLGRGMSPHQEFSQTIINTFSWKGALADSLLSLIQSVNVSEGDKSFGALTDRQRDALLIQINKLYKAIGEPEVEIQKKPTVYINC